MLTAGKRLPSSRVRTMLLHMVRPALAQEVARLSELAMRSKGVWGYPAELMAAFREELTITPEEVDTIFVREVDCRIVGFYALQHLADVRVELGYLFVDPSELRRGHGTVLLHDAMTRAQRNGYRVLVIQGDPHAVGFYLASGACKVGERESDSVPGRMLPLFEIDLGPA